MKETALEPHHKKTNEWKTTSNEREEINQAEVY